MTPAEKIPLKKKLGIALGLPLWVAAAFMASQVFVVGLMLGVDALGVSLEGANQAVVSAVLGGATYLLSIALIIGVPWLIFKRKTSLKELGLQRLVHFKDFGWLGLGFISYLVLTMVITAISMALLPFIDFEQEQVTGYESIATSFEYVLAFMGLVIIAPVAEEVMFRGYLFGKLEAAKVKLWLNVLIVSLLFAIVHFQGNVGVDVFALSIVLCLLRVFSKSLWPAIMLHMLKNGIAFYVLFIDPSILGTLGG